MRKKKKFIINLNYKSTPLFFIIFLLIITLALSSPVYTNSSQKELKGRSNSYISEYTTQKEPQNRSGLAPSGKLSQSSSTPIVENNNPSGSEDNSITNKDRSSKLMPNPGKVIRHPPPPPPEPPNPIPEPPPKPPKPRHPRERHPGDGCWYPVEPIAPPTGDGDENEEDLEAPDAGNTLTPGKSNGLPGKENHINDSFSLDPVLAKKIDEYNAKHLNQAVLEYPHSHWGTSLTFQLLESLELIEHMENKIQYYKQQLDAVRNSDLSPAEKSSKELFWLERIERLHESKQKEEERVSELRSQIAEENRKL
jgi:hypothetical protein